MTHDKTCPVEIRAAEYRAFIRRGNTVGDTYTDTFEDDPPCTCKRPSPDRVVTLLVGFEERFDANGHDVMMPEGIQGGDIGSTVLQCKSCDVRVTIHTHKHNGWSMDETSLDQACRS